MRGKRIHVNLLSVTECRSSKSPCNIGLRSRHVLRALQCTPVGLAAHKGPSVRCEEQKDRQYQARHIMTSNFSTEATVFKELHSEALNVIQPGHLVHMKGSGSSTLGTTQPQDFHVQGTSTQVTGYGPRLKRLLELLEALHGLHGVQSRHHGAVRLPLYAEATRIRHQRCHVLHQLLLKAGLLNAATQLFQN